MDEDSDYLQIRPYFDLTFDPLLVLLQSLLFVFQFLLNPFLLIQFPLQLPSAPPHATEVICTDVVIVVVVVVIICCDVCVVASDGKKKKELSPSVKRNGRRIIGGKDLSHFLNCSSFPSFFQ